MIPELGHFALAIALALSIAQAVLALAGAATGRAALMATARPIAAGQFVFVAGAFAALAACFVGNDFSVRERRHQLQLEPAHRLPLRRDAGARTRARCCSGR